uniref:Lipopolysaccharide-induced tumor necrosis factor-alpha factor homolog n=1 Tax=Kryptolebias marmoratus TaxID=37003 RepID=A0A3Q3F751_KRYMA
MEPPSYEEASRHPTINNSFTPGHGNFDSSPSTPPPTYRDAVAVVSQPQPVPIVVTSLIDSPGLVRCPHCRHLITTKVAYKPGWAAWCTCTMLALMGLICGFCLIPLMMRRLQDAHHFCPNCGEKVHIYKR